MSLTAGKAILLSSAAGGGYEVSRSLRFNSSDSAYLSRSLSSSPSSSFTFSMWVKRSALTPGSTYQTLIGGYQSAGAISIGFGDDDVLRWTDQTTTLVSSTAKFRDPSAWYHIVATRTSSARTIYVNGTQVATGDGGQAWTNGAAWTIGVISGFFYFSGYLADIHFIDGQALDPTSFTEVSATTGQLIPKAYTGTFTGNSFWLKFADNSAATATTLGKDSSGLGNNWTPNNLSVTAGAGNDSLVDTPSSAGTDTGLGGQVTGNYATFNPLIGVDNRTLSNGNLDYAVGGSNTFRVATTTIAVSSGKYYVEVSNFAGGAFGMLGIVAGDLSSQELNQDRIQDKANVQAKGYVLFEPHNDYYRIDGGSSVSYTIGTPSGSDVLGFALNMDAKTCQLYKNGIALGSVSFSSSALANKAVYFVTNEYSGRSGSFNAGQRPFAYTAPSGFKALCTANLPTPTITNPSTVMDVKLYTGNGSTQTISGLGFSPDLVWIKKRSAAGHGPWYDSVRGIGKAITSSLTNSEYTAGSTQELTAFNSDGFSLGTDYNFDVNTSSQTFVGWCWDAGSSTVTNTQGSITSQVRANASAGFSIVTWTGNGVGGATIGHGLNVAPSMIIIKQRDQADNWVVGHTLQGWSSVGFLNLTNAWGVISYFNNTAPSSTTFQVSGSAVVNRNGYQFVAYCFAPVAGYSAMGSYVGNGSSDGPFQWCGFRPRWVMWKNSSAAGSWYIHDSARSTYNVTKAALFPNLSDSENSTYSDMDILSNGFKQRRTDSDNNASGNTYVWAAFAESPFQYARAR